MLEADFTTGAILISFGAVLGVASPVQLIFMIIAEVVFYNVGFYKNLFWYKMRRSRNFKKNSASQKTEK